MSKIVWDKVTRFSKIIAVIVAIGILLGGFYLGRLYQAFEDEYGLISGE